MVGRVNVVLHRNVHSPSVFNGSFQRHRRSYRTPSQGLNPELIPSQNKSAIFPGNFSSTQEQAGTGQVIFFEGKTEWRKQLCQYCCCGLSRP